VVQALLGLLVVMAVVVELVVAVELELVYQDQVLQDQEVDQL
tara:strand:+ start:361 stop:486 length:126 start_codon:yes stop_codon:yes gene_type:complete